MLDNAVERTTLTPVTSATGRTAGTSLTAQTTDTRSSSSTVSATAEASPLRGGTRIAGSNRNLQTGGLQQTLNYLDGLSSRLQNLRSDIVARLADADSGGEGLQSSLQQVGQQWQARGSDSGGRLGATLDYVDPGPARQRFTVRGLDLASLSSGDRETLAISIGGNSSSAVSLSVDPTLTQRQQLQRLNLALAPLGLHASADSDGRLVFDVAEDAWAAVRDSLSIRGEGQRFPTGAFNRVRTETEAAALQPEKLAVDDEAALRRSLSEVEAALERVRASREQLRRLLAQQMQSLPTDTSTEQVWASGFTESFAAQGAQATYTTMSEVLPALAGISRSRVLALLSE